MLRIACDESGHTGPELTNEDQQFFAYASINMEDNEAWNMLQELRAKYRIQMPELKAKTLLGRGSGQSFVAEVVERCEGRYAVNVYNKLLALCGWLFEYIYEPVYNENRAAKALLYEKNLHRFVQMMGYIFFTARDAEASEAIRQFQAYIRKRKEEDAPLLFARNDGPMDGSGNPFQLISRFAHGYRDRILKDNAKIAENTADGGKWVIDLSASALWSHLNYWGRRGEPLFVRCDASKPLQAHAATFRGDASDPAIRYARELGVADPLGWIFAHPIEFSSSSDHPAIQVADILAGTATACVAGKTPESFRPNYDAIRRHMLPDTMFPQMEAIDLTLRGPLTNYYMLFDLAHRAENNLDPFEGLAEMYRQAEIKAAKGSQA